MIFGIGTDIVRVERIQEVYDKYAEHFVERLLLPAEEQAFRQHNRPVRFLAMRFAAKEAIVKAMGTGFAHGMWIRDCGVVANTWGRPEIIWSQRGRELCEKLGIGEGHVTLTDEAGLVVAMAVLMRKANSGGG
jgi:holo-[acyl-carrier protein] synthase